MTATRFHTPNIPVTVKSALAVATLGFPVQLLQAPLISRFICSWMQRVIHLEGWPEGDASPFPIYNEGAITLPDSIWVYYGNIPDIQAAICKAPQLSCRSPRFVVARSRQGGALAGVWLERPSHVILMGSRWLFPCARLAANAVVAAGPDLPERWWHYFNPNSLN